MTAQHEVITGVWERIPQRGHGEPLVGARSTLKLKAFVNFRIKEGPKRKDLAGKCLPALCGVHARIYGSDDQPLFLVSGGGAVRPYLDPPLFRRYCVRQHLNPS